MLTSMADFFLFGVSFAFLVQLFKKVLCNKLIDVFFRLDFFDLIGVSTDDSLTDVLFRLVSN